MGATSVEGVGGVGLCGKLTTKELAILATGPSILVTGQATLAEDVLINPPSPSVEVVLPKALPGSYVNYAVFITSVNSGAVYIATFTNNSDGDFSEFRIIGEAEGTCMYMVTRKGVAPSLES